MKESMQEFRRKAQSTRIKSFSEDYFRVFSVYLTWLTIRFTKLTGNQITFVWVIVGLICAAFYIPGTYKFTLIAGALYFLRHTLDRVDGEVARYKGQQSKRGVAYDLIGHWIYEPLIFITAAIGIYRTTGQWLIFIPAFLALYGYYVGDLINQVFRIHKPGSKDVVDKHGSSEEQTDVKDSFKFKIYRAIRFITFVDYFQVVLLVASLFNIMWVFIVLNAIGLNFLWFTKLISEILDKEKY